jgi:hypothetical protein
MHQVPDDRRRRAAELARVRPKRQLALGLIVLHDPAIKNEDTGRPRCDDQRDRDKLLQVSPIQSAANCLNERHDCNHSPKSAKSQKAWLMQGRCMIGHRAFPVFDSFPNGPCARIPWQHWAGNQRHAATIYAMAETGPKRRCEMKVTLLAIGLTLCLTGFSFAQAPGGHKHNPTAHRPGSPEHRRCAVPHSSNTVAKSACTGHKGKH